MGLVRGLGQDLPGGFAGEDQNAGDAGVQAGFHIRVDPVAHHAGFLFPDAVFLHGKLRHQGGGFADDHRPLFRGVINHIADAAAVGNTAEFRGADIVRVGGDVGNIRPGQQQKAYIPELPEGQLRIEAHDDAIHQGKLLGDPEALPAQLRFQRFGAADIEGLALMVLVQVIGCGLGGGQKILPGGPDAQLFQLADIVIHAFGGIIGQKQVFAARCPEGIQKRRGKFVKPVPQVQGAVHIKQVQLLAAQNFVFIHHIRTASAESAGIIQNWQLPAGAAFIIVICRGNVNNLPSWPGIPLN